MRGQDALRHAGRPRRVHLQRPCRRHAPRSPGSIGGCGREPPLVFVADGDDLEVLRDGGGDLGARPRDTPAPAISTVRRRRRRCLSSSARRSRQFSGTVHGADLARGEQQLDDLGRGAVEVRDARARAPRRRRAAPGRAGWSARRAPRRSATASRADRDDVAAFPGLVAEDVRDAQLLSQHEVNSTTPGRVLMPRSGVPREEAAIASSTSGSSVGYRWPDSSRICRRLPAIRSAARCAIGDRDDPVVGAVDDQRRGVDRFSRP